MKIAVVGTREFNNYEFLKLMLDRCKVVYGDVFIVTGGAKGADSLAMRWAKENKCGLQVYYPDWDKYGKGAGVIRNQLIVDDCDFVLAFWDGKSRGTYDTIKKAKKSGKKVHICWRK